MKIGALARATGTAVETIRFYEREALLPAPARTDSNYRIYDASHADRLGFIRHCRSLDMALGEIRALLRLKDAPHGPCAQVNAVLDVHIDHVVRRVEELKALEARLRALRERCQGNGGATGPEPAAGDCAILAELSAPAAGAAAPRGGARHVHGTH